MVKTPKRNTGKRGRPLDVESERSQQSSLKNWGDKPDAVSDDSVSENVSIDCGWGQLIFGQTFSSSETLMQTLRAEKDDERNIAIYVREPHVVLATAPQSLFLDPSHTFRLPLDDHATGSDALAESAKKAKNPNTHFEVRDAKPGDERAINRIYRAWSMVPVRHNYLAPYKRDKSLTVLVAEQKVTRDKSQIVGVVMGVDHVTAFNDPDNGSSLWALAVDPQIQTPGLGRTLIVGLASRFKDAGRNFMDLSVMHDNAEAIDLYGKLGFEQIPVYSVKCKNPINENLFIGPSDDANLNIYAKIIINEAKRRGIKVEIEDEKAGLFKLSHGGRSISCHESLCDLTTSVAMTRCSDKALTRRLLKKAGLRVPDQMDIGDDIEEALEFLKRHDSVVVKPAKGEQGIGVSVDLTTEDAVRAAIKSAWKLSDNLIMEEFIDGQDLRIIVIDNEVVAAAVRRPPVIHGDGKHTVEDLIRKLSRRRENATDGESRIPMDSETERSVADAGYKMDSVLPDGEQFAVRKTANLHTGGTIHDVTEDIHISLESAAIEAARTLEMPVVGLDLMVGGPSQPNYAIIEANERPGLANHEPQPTAERFIDLLFPQTRPASARAAAELNA